MTNVRYGRWLLVAITIVGFAVALPVVSAHGTDTTAPNADDAPTTNATTDEWATWMNGHMTAHMGPGSVEWMESHVGVTVDEMARDMADDDHNGTDGHDDYGGGMGATSGQSHC
ncbi:hypothetical protein [Halococcoides cellulosivorans]|uniref:Uncharacterized protein n=1 Tax=Halococcoides cellulosivorans TaxID=1679096 RepID=A0A2R4X4Q7_9EURY|nr:hypothetical protein [Halococcoides cellulosivorans]AWB28673.1 hypothetical protein HARCEL1_07720 [Halococcoides cellulosivorans]